MPKPVHEFQKNAAECERMARITDDLEERLLWRGLAEKWQRMTPPGWSESAVFDRLEAEVGTGQPVSDTAH